MPYDNETASKTAHEWKKSFVTAAMKVEDGENFDEIVQRADAALQYLHDLAANTIVVVAHAHILRTIITRVLLGDNLTAKGFANIDRVAQLANTSISAISYVETPDNPHWRLEVLNDYAHLAE